MAEAPESSIKQAEGEHGDPRLPRSVQAVYLKPLRRQAKYGVPSCDLQLRSYNVRNVDFFADFALRAAYYLKLPASGPIPLPRITERWTVPRSNFVHKKSQENFQRITLRRLIQIQDGHPEIVEIWLAFLKKHAYYGVGMKANLYEHANLGVGKTMDVSLENLKQVLEPKWAHFGRKKNLDTSEKVVELLSSERFRHTADAPLTRM
ncbi:MAG: mitochondrial 37S ribosomal protein rsm10 [Pleopsidium flavum]|nr:MAG: mitochondrial 37S ribosomal protein rsm10 [Pleopsidium flavum]